MTVRFKCSGETHQESVRRRLLYKAAELMEWWSDHNEWFTNRKVWEYASFVLRHLREIQKVI